MSNQPNVPKPDKRDKARPQAPGSMQEEPGSTAVEHEPDPNAKPIPDGEHKYMPRSPFTTGND